jgi:hypothetical protein
MVSLQSTSNVGRIVRNGITLGVVVNTLLVGIGILIHPASVTGDGGLLSLLGPALILLAYFLVGRRADRATSASDESATRIGARFGLAAGFVFASEILLEYLILPDTRTNIMLGWIEYAAAFLLFALAALWTSYRIGQAGAGVRAAFWSAIIASLIWLAVLHLTTYAWWGTARQEQVFRAEGDYEDFVRSGMRDFRAFTLQDLRGASFFHLLLAPAIAVTIGLAASMLGKGLHRINPNSATLDKNPGAQPDA